MANVLIGWEFGGNRGHATTAVTIARTLRKLGHKVTFALQRIDALLPDEVEGSAVWQAPLTPRLLVNSGRRRGPATHSHGDTLAKLGLDDPHIVAAIIRAWHELFAAVKPDIVCAEFAPLMLLAARGSMPTFAFGTGFTLPPAALESFPSFTGTPGMPENQTLDSINQALAEFGRTPLGSLPEVYASDECIVATFSELDPYRKFLKRDLVSPCVPLPVEGSSESGTEIFVYTGPIIDPNSQLWDGLAISKLPVRLFMPDIAPSYRSQLRARGFIVEEAPVPFGLIAARSRILLSNGSHGLVCSGLLAGIPQVLCPYDLEKSLTAAEITRLGVGGVAPLKSIRREPFAASLRSIYDNNELNQRAKDLSVILRKRAAKPYHVSVAEAICRVV